ncbi:MAG: radical SAM protein [Parcubacteria group bacterium]
MGTRRCGYRSSGRREDGKYVEHDAIPHLCHLELTYACNQKCLFCYNPERTMHCDLAVIDRIVRSIAGSQVPHVCFLGGEPSLLPAEKLNEYIEVLSEHSSVTITTNGRCHLKGITEKLAFFAVPIHGADASTHESLNRTPGSFEQTLRTIRRYVSEGRVVRAVPLLNGYNYDQMYAIIRLAAELGMESVYVDRYEDGGLGARNSPHLRLKPTLEQFRVALGQIIQARKDFVTLGGRVGFGTAIPYCLDQRLITEGITCNCGVGKDFCAINPLGEFRMCNQSQLVFGTLPDEPIEVIWNKPALDIFRDLSWVSEPCKSCELLLDCTGGCKVDVNCSNQFCVDYAVRGLSEPVNKLAAQVKRCEPAEVYPRSYRIFRPNRYMKLTTRYPEKFLVTRYQTVKLDETALEIAQVISCGAVVNEQALIARFADRVEEREIRLLVSRLFQVDALDLIGEVDHVAP